MLSQWHLHCLGLSVAKMKASKPKLQTSFCIYSEKVKKKKGIFLKPLACFDLFVQKSTSFHFPPFITSSYTFINTTFKNQGDLLVVSYTFTCFW